MWPLRVGGPSVWHLGVMVSSPVGFQNPQERHVPFPNFRPLVSPCLPHRPTPTSLACSRVQHWAQKEGQEEGTTLCFWNLAENKTKTPKQPMMNNK